MAKQNNSDKPTKREIVYETEDCVSIWRYDSKITTNGPISVEHKWKKGFEPVNTNKKTLGDLVNDGKKLVKSKRRKS